MSQMILEYDEFCMFLLNIEVFNIVTSDFPYPSVIAFVADFKEFNLKI
jgi:hypothetical protein